jgi:uncharacterized membrane protein YhaH (DUF805 family)
LDTGDRQIAKLTLPQVLFSFAGRIGRKIYWLNYLAMCAVAIVVYLLFFAIFGYDIEDQTSGVGSAIFGIFTVIIYIMFIWVSLALAAKRWHDRNKSAWWILIGFIPLIGPLWALIENGFLAGDAEVNNYGPPSF